ncbi:MAG: polysaccharide deacetylase family protein [Burkholderiales bacterium]|nr:polysaccharide deacetylase family protein [Burkholderiales bacterium]
MKTTSRWRPSPGLLASGGLHVGALIATTAAPALWPWTLGAVAIDHAILTAAGLWPRSTLLGPNLRRLPETAAARGEVAITIDDGPDPDVTPHVLDLLDAYDAKASFFCIGTQARAHPRWTRAIAERGHDVENHSQHHHHDFSLQGLRGFRREIESAQHTLSELSGRRPRFFRAPAGLRNPMLDPVLHALDLQLASWTRRGFDTVSRDPHRVSARLLHRLRAGDILLLHDGHAARTPAGKAVILDVLPVLLDALRQRDLRPVTLQQATR